MKNLKRVLSLVLATVMVIGMMVVGASAADYKDADKIDYAEAVDVMSAVGMIEGYAGNFGPEGKIDRAGATKLITYLMLGTDVASKLTVSEAPFEDVPANAWYAPFVAFCAEKGLLEGYNGKFYPNEPINAYGFAKLLLGALGYDASIEGMTGDTWQVNVATLAIKNDLFNGNDGAFANEAMTRQEACLYAFNALKATTVEYATKGTNITVDGTVINTGASKAEPVVAAKSEGEDKVSYTATGDGYVQLCEKLYPELAVNDTPDDFGRPGKTWTYGDDGVVAFAGNKPYATYAGEDFKDVLADLVKDKKITAKTLYPVTINTYDLRNEDGNENEYDGADNNTYDKLMDGKLAGATVELYVSKKDVVNIVVVQPVACSIDTITVDEDTDEVTVNVIVNGFHDDKVDAFTVSSEDDEDAYALIKDFDEGEVFAAVFEGEKFWHYNDEDFNQADNLVAVDAVDAVAGKVTAKSTNWIKVDGEKYEFAAAYGINDLTVGDEGTFYLYNGLLVAFVKEKAADTSANVAYVLRAGKTPQKWDDTKYDYFAELLFADGTIKVVDTNIDVTAAKYCAVTYSVDKDIYTLNAAGATAKDSAKLYKGVSELGEGNGVYANDKTVFVIATMNGETVKDVKVYTGVKNLPSMDVDFSARLVKNSNMASYVFAQFNKTEVATATDLIYIAEDSLSAVIYEEDVAPYCTVNAIVGGKVVEIKVAAEASGEDFVQPTFASALYASFDIDENDIYTMGEAASEGAVKDNKAFLKAENGVVGFTTSEDATIYMSYVENLPVYTINADGVIKTVKADARSYDKEGTNVTYTVDKNVVTGVYIVLP